MSKGLAAWPAAAAVRGVASSRAIPRAARDRDCVRAGAVRRGPEEAAHRATASRGAMCHLAFSPIP